METIKVEEQLLNSRGKSELLSTLIESEPIDHDTTIFQALVNEGKHMKVLNTKKVPFSFDEKKLREAAHAEVANIVDPIMADKNLKKRKNMEPDEKAKQSRDRNREHAKNTRLRKKAYVTKLKELVDSMTQQRDMEENERKLLGQKLHETQVQRKLALKDFLLLRTKNSHDRKEWTKLLDENVVFTLPITPYRSFQKSDIKNSTRVLIGIDAIMGDSASLLQMIECIGQGNGQWKEAVKRGRTCTAEYEFLTDDILAAGDTVMCRYIMRIVGHERVGCNQGCVQPGMLQCRFDNFNKIVFGELMFDVMGFMQQLQRVSGVQPEHSIIPNSLDMALRPSKEAIAVISASAPFPILHVNDVWTQLIKRSQSVVEGQGLATALRAHSFQRDLFSNLLNECSSARPCSTICMTHGIPDDDNFNTQNVNDDENPLVFYVKFLPLTAETEKISHILVVLVNLPLSQDEASSLVQQRKQRKQQQTLHRQNLKDQNLQYLNNPYLNFYENQKNPQLTLKNLNDNSNSATNKNTKMNINHLKNQLQNNQGTNSINSSNENSNKSQENSAKTSSSGGMSSITQSGGYMTGNSETNQNNNNNSSISSGSSGNMKNNHHQSHQNPGVEHHPSHRQKRHHHHHQSSGISQDIPFDLGFSVGDGNPPEPISAAHMQMLNNNNTRNNSNSSNGVNSRNIQSVPVKPFTFDELVNSSGSGTFQHFLNNPVQDPLTLYGQQASNFQGNQGNDGQEQSMFFFPNGTGLEKPNVVSALNSTNSSGRTQEGNQFSLSAGDMGFNTKVDGDFGVKISDGSGSKNKKQRTGN